MRTKLNKIQQLFFIFFLFFLHIINLNNFLINFFSLFSFLLQLTHILGFYFLQLKFIFIYQLLLLCQGSLVLNNTFYTQILSNYIEIQRLVKKTLKQLTWKDIPMISQKLIPNKTIPNNP